MAAGKEERFYIEGEEGRNAPVNAMELRELMRVMEGPKVKVWVHPSEDGYWLLVHGIHEYGGSVLAATAGVDGDIDDARDLAREVRKPHRGALAEGDMPVGIVEIADLFGVERDTVNKWRGRDLGFPSPDWTVGGRPAWRRGRVLAWAEATRRQV